MTTHHGGDPARHLSMAALAAAFHARPSPPANEGRLRAIIRRPTIDGRESLQSATLGVQTGLPGDRWAMADSPNPQAQLTAMNATVGEIIGNGQDVALFGDNLIVDLDLHLNNLPIGSRVRLGGCVLEVSPKAHTGCLKYKARFGKDALAFISARDRRAHRLRGLYFTVVQGGEVAVGDTLVVLSRAPSP